MAGFEYKVVPAPGKGVKAKGVKTPEDRFAHGLQELMNELGAEGWEYQRADTLPSTERSGLTGHHTVWRHMLVFRRPRVETAPEPPEEPLKIEHKQEVAPDPEPAPETPERPAGQPGATVMLRDNGVEETSDVAGTTTSLTALVRARKMKEPDKPGSEPSDV